MSLLSTNRDVGWTPTCESKPGSFIRDKNWSNMDQITNKDLIEKAKSVIKPRKIVNDSTVGDVGCALVTDKGNIYVGASIDAASGLGFCAEASAIANMVTNGEERISKIVAVSEDGTILSPCGRCRELMHQIHKENLETEIILAEDKTLKLRDLRPYPWDESWS